MEVLNIVSTLRFIPRACVPGKENVPQEVQLQNQCKIDQSRDIQLLKSITESGSIRCYPKKEDINQKVLSPDRKKKGVPLRVIGRFKVALCTVEGS